MRKPVDRYTESITGRVTATKRAGTSRNGNPSWDVTIETSTGETRTIRTASDLSLSYGITNPEYRDTVHEYGISRAGKLNGYARRA